MLAPRGERGETEGRKLGELPSACGQRKLELWSRPAEDGSPRYELVEYRWGSGLGWYRQKHLVLDSEQIDALRALLPEARPAPPRRRSVPRVLHEGSVIRLLFSE